MKLIGSYLEDSTRTAFLVGSSKLEAAAIGRSLSLQHKREMSATDPKRTNGPVQVRCPEHRHPIVLAPDYSLMRMETLHR